MTRLTILTGSSRGLGLAMAQRLIKPGDRLLCIARRTSEELARRAAEVSAQLTQWSLDLTHSELASDRLEQWLARHADEAFATVTLINNAGTIATVSPVGELGADDVSHTIAVGLIAPMHLCTAFLRGTRHWPGARRVLNVSSGLARRPMASQSPYCAAKAGLDHFTRVLALEEATQPNGARVCALSPGGIDSDMMEHLRNADPYRFPDHATFIKAKAEGRLMSPERAAQRVLDFLDRADFGANPIADLRDPVTTGA